MNSAYVTEANKISTGGVWLLLLEIATEGYIMPLRYTSNNDTVTWLTNIYTALPFSLDDVSVSTSGAFPEYTLQMGEVDLTGALYTRIKETDGLVGSTVRFMVVHSERLTVTEAAVDEYTEILSCELTAQVVTFKLGMPSLLSRRFPRDRYAPSYCRHKFGGALCQYSRPVGATLTSSQVAFVAGVDYDTIWVNDGGLLEHIFAYEPGYMGAPYNLIANGSFEQYTSVETAGWYGGKHYDSWETWGSTSTATRYVTVEKAKYDTHSLLIQCNATIGGVYQTVTVVAGQPYTFSCWVFVRYTMGIGAYGIRMRTEPTPGLGYTETYGDYGGWQRLTLTVIPTTNQLTVWLGGQGRAFFDGMSIVKGSGIVDYSQRILANDAVFTVSGSASNDGYFIAYGGSNYPLYDTYVKVRKGTAFDRTFTTESPGAAVTLQLGHPNCDHTLPACRIRNNSQNFGGSPGIRGGVYG